MENQYLKYSIKDSLKILDLVSQIDWNVIKVNWLHTNNEELLINNTAMLVELTQIIKGE